MTDLFDMIVQSFVTVGAKKVGDVKVKDLQTAYSRLKSVLVRSLDGRVVDQLEINPSSKAELEILAQAIKAKGPRTEYRFHVVHSSLLSKYKSALIESKKVVYSAIPYSNRVETGLNTRYYYEGSASSL